MGGDASELAAGPEGVDGAAAAALQLSASKLSWPRMAPTRGRENASLVMVVNFALRIGTQWPPGASQLSLYIFDHDNL